MADGVLLRAVKLGHRAALLRHVEDRVVAEAVAAARLVGDPAPTDASSPVDPSVRHSDSEDSDVLAAAPLGRQAVQQIEDQAVLDPVVGAAPARRDHPRLAAKRVNLEARVLSKGHQSATRLLIGTSL